jgi:hypothetical protein
MSIFERAHDLAEKCFVHLQDASHPRKGLQLSAEEIRQAKRFVEKCRHIAFCCLDDDGELHV